MGVIIEKSSEPNFSPQIRSPLNKNEESE